VNDEQSAAQFMTLVEKLKAGGFEHYEISNYSKPDKYALHNTNYWRGIPYLGIGPSAHGFDGQTRYHNIANNAAYLSKLQLSELAETIEELNIYDRFNEYIMTSLRTMWGINLKKILADYGKVFLEDTLKNSKTFIERQWLITENDHLILSSEGKLFADHLASEFFLMPEDHR